MGIHLSTRTVIAQTHRWSGAVSFVLLFLVSFSGILAGFTGTIMQMQYGAVVSPPAPPAGSHYANVDDLLKMVRDGYGPAFTPRVILMERTRFEVDAALVFGSASENDGTTRSVGVALGPYRNTYLGAFHTDESWVGFIIKFHDSLLLGENGKITVALLGVLLIFFAATGIYQWWPRQGRPWRKATTFKLFGSRYGKLFQLHGLIGLWSLPFVVLWAFTGAYLLKSDWFGNVLPGLPSEPPPSVVLEFAAPCQGGSVSPGEAATRGQAAFPNARFTSLMMPSDKRAYYGLTFERHGDYDKLRGDLRAWVSSVCIDRIHTHVLDDSAMRTRLGAMVSSLHFGHTFGWFGTPIIVMTGLMICTGSVVGFLVWWAGILGRYQRINRELRRQKS